MKVIFWEQKNNEKSTKLICYQYKYAISLEKEEKKVQSGMTAFKNTRSFDKLTETEVSKIMGMVSKEITLEILDKKWFVKKMLEVYPRILGMCENEELTEIQTALLTKERREFLLLILGKFQKKEPRYLH